MNMEQNERRLSLIRELIRENPSLYSDMEIPTDIQGQRDLLRALMNVRMPDPIDEEFLLIQDAYLQEENREGITDIDTLTPCAIDPRLYLWQGDITTLRVDAIVNAANSALLGCFRPLHSCIDNIIHSKAGIALRLKCKHIIDEQGHDEETGCAKITPAYNLPCRHVLHTVGPIVKGRLTEEHKEQLASCYRSCLDLAAENGITSIAFCCISTGVFMFPNREAAEIAVATVREWLNTHNNPMHVIFDVYKDEDRMLYATLLSGKNENHV